MNVEMGEISCGNEATQFVIDADGKSYTFVVANELIYPYIGEDQKIDCPQFILESQEIFEELAEEVISMGVGEGPIVIDRDLLTTYFV